MGHLQIYACFNFNSLKCAPVPSNKILLLLYYYYIIIIIIIDVDVTMT